MSLITIKDKYQIVIPAKVRKEAGLRVGDFLVAAFEKGKIILAPKIMIDSKHVALLPKWLRTSLRDVKEGRMSGPFDSVSQLKKHLER